MLMRLGTEDILDSGAIVYFEAGVAEWLSRWPRDPKFAQRGPVPKHRQASQWALCPQGFESLPRRQFLKRDFTLILAK
jgi:hypothetical protein